MKRKVAVLGADNYFDLLAFDNMSESYTLSILNPEVSVVSVMSNPITYDRGKLFSDKDQKLIAKLLNEYDKGTLNDLIASNPDILILDFFSDIKFGISETFSGEFITNNHDYYAKNESFKSLKLFRNYNLSSGLDPYINIWSQALKEFMNFMKTYLPKTLVVIVDNTEDVPDSTLIDEVVPKNICLNKIWKKLNEFAKRTYDLAIIYDLTEIEFMLNNTVENNIYEWNLIRNPKFESNARFWTNFGEIPLTSIKMPLTHNQLVLGGNRDKVATFSLLSSPIHIGASLEYPKKIELTYEIYVEDIFGLELTHDHIFICRGFKK